jgi:hypothetical protein
MIILRNPEEERRDSESYSYHLSDLGLLEDWNVAFFDARGIGEYGWSPELQWHVRRASAWTGRTIASMRVYDVLRCIEFCRTMENVDETKIGIVARGEMAVVALFTALLDGECEKLILKDPPSTLDTPSSNNGRGEAIELLNALQILDLNMVPALLYPTKIIFENGIPEDYQWSVNVLENVKWEGSIQVLNPQDP